jgi:hypothetical protein
MRVERLPFTVYDIVGYLIPGVFFCTIFVSVYFSKPAIQSLKYISKIDAAPGISWPILILLVFLFLVTGYIVGHGLALLSAESIEYLTAGMIGYPSTFLVSNFKNEEKFDEHIERCICKFQSKQPIYSAIIMLILIPYTLSIRTIRGLRLTNILIKPVGEHASRLFREKFTEYFKAKIEDLEPTDWFRLVDFYVAKDKESYFQQRQYNYVTLYGFCRNMSFVLYITFIIIFLKLYMSSNEISDAIIIPMLTVGLLSLIGAILLFFGFIKYFRRYSQEAILSFVVLTEQKIENKKTD